MVYTTLDAVFRESDSRYAMPATTCTVSLLGGAAKPLTECVTVGQSHLSVCLSKYLGNHSIFGRKIRLFLQY
jgi:hypothetical protein